MSEKFYWIIGFIVGLLLVFAIASVTALIAKKKSGGKKPQGYDERQVLARGAAFSTSFFTAVIYMVVCGLLDVIEIHWAPVNIQMFLGLFLSVAVFASISILKDAYYTKNSPKKRMLILFSVVSVLNLFTLIENIVHGGSLIENGMLSDLSINLGVFVVFTEILAVTIVKSFMDRKAVEEE